MRYEKDNVKDLQTEQTTNLTTHKRRKQTIDEHTNEQAMNQQTHKPLKLKSVFMFYKTRIVRQPILAKTMG